MINRLKKLVTEAFIAEELGIDKEFLFERSLSKAGEQARELGLKYFSFGRWGTPEGVVTHKEMDGGERLVQLKKTEQEQTKKASGRQSVANRRYIKKIEHEGTKSFKKVLKDPKEINKFNPQELAAGITSIAGAHEVERKRAKYTPTKHYSLQKLVHSTIKQYASLTPKEYEAVNHYTGNGYDDINDALRKDDFERLKSYDDTLKNLDSAMKKAVTDQDLVVMRGINRGEADGLESAMKKPLKLNAYLSSSLRLNVAYDHFGDTGLMMIIRVPKGSRGIFVPGLSSHETESEFLLDRGSELRVIRKEKNDQRITYVCELVKQTQEPIHKIEARFQETQKHLLAKQEKIVSKHIELMNKVDKDPKSVVLDPDSDLYYCADDADTKLSNSSFDVWCPQNVDNHIFLSLWGKKKLVVSNKPAGDAYGETQQEAAKFLKHKGMIITADWKEAKKSKAAGKLGLLKFLGFNSDAYDTSHGSIKIDAKEVIAELGWDVLPDIQDVAQKYCNKMGKDVSIEYHDDWDDEAHAQGQIFNPEEKDDEAKPAQDKPEKINLAALADEPPPYKTSKLPVIDVDAEKIADIYDSKLPDGVTPKWEEAYRYLYGIDYEGYSHAVRQKYAIEDVYTKIAIGHTPEEFMGEYGAVLAPRDLASYQALYSSEVKGDYKYWIKDGGLHPTKALKKAKDSAEEKVRYQKDQDEAENEQQQKADDWLSAKPKVWQDIHKALSKQLQDPQNEGLSPEVADDEARKEISNALAKKIQAHEFVLDWGLKGIFGAGEDKPESEKNKQVKAAMKKVASKAYQKKVSQQEANKAESMKKHAA